MTLYDPTRTPPYPSADSDLSPTEIARAEEFNLWCAIHGRPFHLGRHTWADGRIEWGVEVDPGKPTGTLAYGTGQIDERQAVVAAFAFLAGLEWADAARRAASPEAEELDEDDEDLDEDVTEAASVAAPAEPALPPDLSVPQRRPAAILAHALGAREPTASRELPRPIAEDEDEDVAPGRVLPFAPPRVVASTPAPIPTAIPDEPSGRIEPTLGPLPTAPITPPAPVIEPPVAAAAPVGTPPAAKAPEPEPKAPAAAAPATPAAEPASSVVIRRPAELSAAPARATPHAYNLPPVSVLATAPVSDVAFDEAQLAQNAKALEVILKNFGVRGEIMEVRPGPVVTLYELEPAPGTKSARIINLADDIARSMSAVAVRIAVVPGRSVIGIELPNPKRETVYLSQMLGSAAYQDEAHRLPLTLGKDIGGEPVVADLARMPHLLIAGTTGSGKSVGINTMILSLIYRLPPDRCRFIMIDPKMLELSVYDGIPHLLTPVVTEPKKAVVALKWAVREMESRYRAMAKLGVRNIEGYNAKVVDIAQSVGATPLVAESLATDADGEEEATKDPTQRPLATLPYIVIVVDEMADLMLVAGKDIEGVIQRLAQMARAAGIHLIMATQRPSVDVITGTIKANFPTRISFQVTSKIDSRTILGEGGAEQLLGQGDMLYMAGGGRITRVHGPFVADREVEMVVAHLKSQGQPSYLDNITRDDEDEPPAAPPARGTAGPVSLDEDDLPGSSGDDLYDQAVALVLRERKASVSFIQRHLQIGYNRSARIVERMEQERILGPANHVGKREILLGRGGGGRGFDDED